MQQKKIVRCGQERGDIEDPEDIESLKKYEADLLSQASILDINLRSFDIDSPNVVNALRAYKRSGRGELFELLAKKYEPLIIYIAKRLASSMPNPVEVGDLISDGFVGFMKAVETFDEKKGIEFKTFASHRIRREMLDGLISRDWVPHLVRSRSDQYKKAFEALYAGLGREPNDFEIAKQLKISLKKFYQFFKPDSQTIDLLSIDEESPIQDSKSVQKSSLSDLIEDSSAKNPNASFNEREFWKEISKALSNVDDVKILWLRVHEDLTAKQVANMFGVCQSRISQRENKAKKRLREVGIAQLGRSAYWGIAAEEYGYAYESRLRNIEK